MKLTKKHWTIIGVVIALIAIWYFFLRKKKAPESNYRMTRRRRVISPYVVSETLPVGVVPAYVTASDLLTPTTTLSKTSNPIEDCINKCQMKMPREYCISYCTGGQDTQPPSTTL